MEIKDNLSFPQIDIFATFEKTGTFQKKWTRENPAFYLKQKLVLSKSEEIQMTYGPSDSKHGHIDAPLTSTLDKHYSGISLNIQFLIEHIISGVEELQWTHSVQEGSMMCKTRLICGLNSTPFNQLRLF